MAPSTGTARARSSPRSLRVCVIIPGIPYPRPPYTGHAYAKEGVRPAAQHVAPPPQFSDEDLPTVEAVVAQKRREAEERLAKAAAAREAEGAAPAGDAAETAEGTQAALAGGPEALEAEAGQQGAFNPETGEINWDCPCLGGMADGPCGEEFKAAFSCFVYSKEEPKGMDCIDKFQYVSPIHPEPARGHAPEPARGGGRRPGPPRPWEVQAGARAGAVGPG